MAEETRRPDPTLSAMPRGYIMEFITADVYGEPAEAHRIDSQHASGPMIPAGYARWFAVPCRECFPDAPPPGTRIIGEDVTMGGVVPITTEGPGLAWQLGETR